MKVIKPTTITSSSIISSSLAETIAAWSSATIYSIGTQVHDGLEGIYQALTASTNKQPSLNPLDWLYIKPSNRWAVFDSQINTASTATTSMTFKLATGLMQGLALLNLDASAVTISVTDSRGWEYANNLSGTTWGSSGIARAAAWTGSQFCVVGDGGRVATSPDSITWTYRGGLASTTWGSSGAADAIAWTGTQFCVVGDGGRAATSPDGVTWTYQSSLSATTWGSTASVNAIAWTGSQFCVVGDGGRVATSPDGVTWTYRGGLITTTWSTGNATAIAWTGSQFCVVGDGGRVATSPDGITWTYRGGLISTTWSTSNVTAIAWTGSQFCVVGDGGKVATSPDGATWTYRGGLITTTWGSSGIVRGIAWNGTRFCVVGDAGRSATSLDGITWTYQSNLSATSWSTANARAIIWASTQFLTVGDSGKASTSPNGITPVVIYTATQNLISSTILDWYEYFFLDQDTKRTQAIFADLPLLNYTDTYTTVTITGVGTISAGTITFGKIIVLGTTEYGASSGITDYSVKLTDEFGQTTFVRRAYSKRMSGRVLVNNADLNKVQRTLYGLRAVPSLWFASENPSLEEALIVFGYYRDFSTDVSYPTYSYCSLEIEGLI